MCILYVTYRYIIHILCRVSHPIILVHKNCINYIKYFKYTYIYIYPYHVFYTELLLKKSDLTSDCNPVQAEQGSAASTADASGRLRSLKRCAVGALGKIKGLTAGFMPFTLW